MRRRNVVYSGQEAAERPAKREHCRKCTFYLNGHAVVYESGAPMFSPMPGMQFHQHTKGTIYQRRGYLTPCECETGSQIREAYEKRNEE